MDRIIDKAIVLMCCVAGLALQPWQPLLLVAMLCAVVVAALTEIIPAPFRAVPVLVFGALCLFVPPFTMFLPLAVYDFARDERIVVRVAWALPALLAPLRFSIEITAVVLIACGVSFLLALRTQRAQGQKISHMQVLDNVREASLALEEKNRDLRDRQDMEVHVATLAERDRIAREIHDNVGHLLTRSIMQVEALQVVHRADQQVCGELSQVGVTLHEAMDTVRTSVHNLHDDAFNLEAKITEAAASCAPLAIDLDYRAENIPADVAYCFIAIVREALSNTVKHSDAVQVSISVVAYPAFFRLVVHDNGTKQPLSDVFMNAPTATTPFAALPDRYRAQARGMGMVTMFDRARALGGLLRTNYDRGFKVFVTIPRKDTP